MSFITEFFVEPVSVNMQPSFNNLDILLATSFIDPTGIQRTTKSASKTVSSKLS